MSFHSSIESLLFLVAQVSEAVQPSSGAAPEGGAAPGAPGGGFTQIMPFLMLAIVIMYFLTIRPQQKRDKERQAMLNALSKGDEVITAGGICGKVVGITDNDVVLRVDDEVKIKFLRSSISHVIKEKEDGK